MSDSFLLQAAVFLGAAAIAAPLAKRARIGAVLGYLIAGILIGPFGIGLVYTLYEVEEILHFAEFGVVMLLFLIGLELRPRRLWTMRNAIAGLGGAQVFVTSLAFFAIGVALGLDVKVALFVGLVLSLSSTALAVQVLEENGELTTRHGRSALSILLFQDLTAIPLIAMVPVFAPVTASLGSWTVGTVLVPLLMVAAVIIIGRYVVRFVYPLVAETRVNEAMTAVALLTVVGVAILMDLAGLSAALGAFLAGVLLADSEYRHEIHANIAPFSGLLLGLFFTAVGMSLNLRQVVVEPFFILALVIGLLAVKITVLYILARVYGHRGSAARRVAISLSQGGEFAFFLFTLAVSGDVLSDSLADSLAVAVTLSMMLTPLLLGLERLLSARSAGDPAFEEPPEAEGHVIIAGFGRVGQIVARILSAKGVPFTALDNSSEQVDFVAHFGSKIYYGDSSRLDILRAAQADKASALVLAIDDVERSLHTATVVRNNFPNLKIYARARNRDHVHRLMDIGVEEIRRETFLSSVNLTGAVLRGLGVPEADVRRTLDLFSDYDRRRLYEDYKHYSDLEKMAARARRYAEELETLFNEDAERARESKMIPEEPAPQPSEEAEEPREVQDATEHSPDVAETASNETAPNAAGPDKDTRKPQRPIDQPPVSPAGE